MDSPLGTEIPHRRNEKNLRGRVIGVVGDSHIRRLQQELAPALLRLRSGNGTLRYIFARIGPDDTVGTLELLKETWGQAVPDQPFAYSFLDEDVGRALREDERWMGIVRYSAMFAIFVACLGALGLTSLAVARRTKEIGIRKVLGASASRTLAMLGKELTWLIVAATIVAGPLAYAIMDQWLQNFAYRIDQGVGASIVGGVLALLMVWGTVSFQTVRATMRNPIEALRYE